MTTMGIAPRLTRLVVGPAARVPPGARTLVQHGPHQVAVFNVGGRLYAVRNRCPHHGGPLCHGRIGGTRVPSESLKYEWGMVDRVLTCPWHGWQFDLETGATLFDPATSVPVYRVAVEYDEIAVYLPE
jgi:3-phenylpropionate/trans-cinnamate dioxygenase ferredoxin subunit